MERRQVYSLITSLFLLQSSGIAYAELPESFAALPAPPSAPTPPTRPTPPSQTQYEGMGTIEGVTRRTGGEVYRFDFVRATPLMRLELKSKMSRVRVIAASLITDKDERIPVRNLVKDSIMPNEPALVSENLNTLSNISAIEIHAEAMGGTADLEIKAISNREVPRMALRGSAPGNSCKTNIDSALKAKLDPVQLWASRAESAAADSAQEKFAGAQLTKFVNDYIATLKSGNTYTSSKYLLSLLYFFIERLEASRVGGIAETSYRNMTNETYSVLTAAIQNELPCRRFSSEDLLAIALEMNKKRSEVGRGSRSEVLYESMMTKIRDFVPLQYRKELGTRSFTFRQADTEGSKYYRLFTTEKDDGFLKTTHRDMSAFAYAVAEQALIREVVDMDIEQRYLLIVEYQGKYNENSGDIPQATAMRYLTILSQGNNILMKLISK